MYLVSQGDLWFESNGACAALAVGDIVLMPWVAPHRLLSQPGMAARPVEEVMGDGCDVDGWWTVGTGSSCTKIHTIRLGPGKIPRLPRVADSFVLPRAAQTRSLRAIVTALDDELDPNRGAGPGPVSDALVRALWLSALTDKLADVALDYAMARLEEHVRDHIETLTNVAQMARIAGLSRSRLTERFRRCYGEPPMTWLRRLRMQHAHTLIAAGSSVAEVAERMGYASETAFRKAFKRVMGEPAKARS